MERSTLRCLDISREQKIHFKIGYASFGMIVGFSACLVWAIAYQQVWTAAMGGLAGVLALWCLIVHIMYLRNLWDIWRKGLKFSFFAGVFFSLLALVAFITFIVFAITKKESLTHVRSFYLSSVWSLMSLKWSVLLALYSHRYRQELSDISLLSE